ncbi:Syntaphilin_family protein [Hexamita inflata]|uniref:Syntaphilin family protein n=1 Tax=Hexamita inflata TaxID=28002 RepID=A0AA86V5U9_9EUKA|nr:Syntaphilin family protein [Hexamita inflata]
MSSDFDIYYNTIDKMLIDADKAADKVNSQVGENRMKYIDQILDRIQPIEEEIALAENELPMISNIKEREQASIKVGSLNSRVSSLKQKINQLNQARPSTQDEDVVQEKVVLSDMNKVQVASVLLDAAKVQLHDADQALTEVVVLNNEITTVLAADLIKLNKVNDDLTGIQAENAIAKKQLKQLAQRVTSNKCYMAVFFLVVLGVLGLTVWDIVNTYTKK